MKNIDIKRNLKYVKKEFNLTIKNIIDAFENNQLPLYVREAKFIYRTGFFKSNMPLILKNTSLYVKLKDYKVNINDSNYIRKNIKSKKLTLTPPELGDHEQRQLLGNNFIDNLFFNLADYDHQSDIKKLTDYPEEFNMITEEEDEESFNNDFDQQQSLLKIKNIGEIVAIIKRDNIIKSLNLYPYIGDVMSQYVGGVMSQYVMEKPVKLKDFYIYDNNIENFKKGAVIPNETPVINKKISPTDIKRSVTIRNILENIENKAASKNIPFDRKNIKSNLPDFYEWLRNKNTSLKGVKDFSLKAAWALVTEFDLCHRDKVTTGIHIFNKIEQEES